MGGRSISSRVKSSIRKFNKSMTALLLLIIAYCIIEILGGVMGGSSEDNSIFVIVFLVLSFIYGKKDVFIKFINKNFGQSLISIKSIMFLDKSAVLLGMAAYIFYTLTAGLPQYYNIGMAIFIAYLFLSKFGILRWIKNLWIVKITNMKKSG